MAMCSSLITQWLAFGAVGASMVAYMVAQFTDVRLFHFIAGNDSPMADPYGCVLNNGSS